VNSLSSLHIGASAHASLTVALSDTAEALAIAPDDAVPRVFATSRMLALMELAAARALKPLLREGELSVGVSADIRHTAATPIGGHVRAVAHYLGLEGKLHRFRLEAFDDAGPIGSGEHTRAVISTERLVAGAARRAGDTPVR
jgi:predicted thioesterase